jgi:hypothetical protein
MANFFCKLGRVCDLGHSMSKGVSDVFRYAGLERHTERVGAFPGEGSFQAKLQLFLDSVLFFITPARGVLSAL